MSIYTLSTITIYLRLLECPRLEFTVILYCIGFRPPRLSPEEQDVAYERKAQHMRLLDSRNAKLKEELLLSRKVRGGPSPRPATSAYDTTLSKASLNKLVKKQDRQAKEGKSYCKFAEVFMNKSNYKGA